MNSQSATAEWFDRISACNRRMLVRPDLRRMAEAPVALAERAKWVIRRWMGRRLPEYWVTATNGIGAAASHRAFGREEDLAALRALFDRHLALGGAWRALPQAADGAMKGYCLLYLAEATGEERYRRAARQLADHLLHGFPRLADGVLPYFARTDAAFVDTLGMVCPFLARYGRAFGVREATDLAVHQVAQFIRQNVDPDSRLPYHAYYPGGPKRIGMQGWGRGTGWYLIGVVDTLLEMPTDHPDYALMLAAAARTAEAVRAYQRPDGHWGWAILVRGARRDSSATSFIGYSLMRGLGAGVLDASLRPTVDAALAALVGVTRPDGVLDESLADCNGLGLYPTTFGPQPWLQGIATAFAALYLGSPQAPAASK